MPRARWLDNLLVSIPQTLSDSENHLLRDDDCTYDMVKGALMDRNGYNQASATEKLYGELDFPKGTSALDMIAELGEAAYKIMEDCHDMREGSRAMARARLRVGLNSSLKADLNTRQPNTERRFLEGIKN